MSQPRVASLRCRTAQRCSSATPGGGTVISEAGVDPKVSALVYVAARAPDAGEDDAGLAAKFPTPPASVGLVKSAGFAQLGEEAFLRDFAAGDPGCHCVGSKRSGFLAATRVVGKC